MLATCLAFPDTRRWFHARLAVRALAAAGLIGELGTAANLRAATLPATAIVNSASVAASIGGSSVTATSNSATITTDEVLDVGLARIGSEPIILRPGIVTAIPFVLTNAGNGSEVFTLTGVPSGIAATLMSFAIDRDGNGKFDAADDTVIAPGNPTPALGPGSSLPLFALVEADAPNGDGSVQIASHAITGSGRRGTVFTGRGDGSVDAIVGPTTAAAEIRIPLVSGADNTTVMLDKSQVVLAADGSSNPTQGATITYSIVARFDGQGDARGSVLSDPIPIGTAYVPGSMLLDGVALTDAADGDRGTASDTGISVALGDVAAPARRTISFQVKIK